MVVDVTIVHDGTGTGKQNYTDYSVLENHLRCDPVLDVQRPRAPRARSVAGRRVAPADALVRGGRWRREVRLLAARQKELLKAEALGRNISPRHLPALLACSRLAVK